MPTYRVYDNRDDKFIMADGNTQGKVLEQYYVYDLKPVSKDILTRQNGDVFRLNRDWECVYIDTRKKGQYDKHLVTCYNHFTEKYITDII